ncbi:glutathione transferase [Bordetella tumbae]|uniref:glutathione transferase n=1 Tax=Bordetella tumbae TaxID=1649139 RepID=UPI0039EF3F82
MSDTLASPLTLYVDAQLLSPYAMSAYVALTEKGLPVELRLVDLQAGEQRMVPYTSRAPTCRVPALTHDAFHLTESSAIIEYLEDVFPAPEYPALYPDTPQQRARARQIQAWLRSDLAALRDERPTDVVFHGAPPSPLSDAGQAAAAKLLRVAQTLLPEGQAQLFGSWSIADTELALMLRRLAGADELPAALQAYADAQWQRPAVQTWLQFNQDARD